MSDYDRKIVMLGDSAVGKTALLHRFVKDSYLEKYRPTVAAKPYKRTVDIDGDSVALVIWDIAGHTLNLHPAYFSGAHGAMLVCDLNRSSTASSLLKWHEILVKKVGDIPTRVLANKSELEWKCDIESLKSRGFEVILTSASTGKNVDSAFLELARAMID